MKCNLQFELLTIYHSKIACKLSYTPDFFPKPSVFFPTSSDFFPKSDGFFSDDLCLQVFWPFLRSGSSRKF